MRGAQDAPPDEDVSTPTTRGTEYDEDVMDSDFITYEGEESYDYGLGDGEMPDDAMYDDDEYEDEYEDELSSSPSIPDENINFELVYALHTFVATVDGQATVQKGDHLVLLDDSNSYWWLVRVMASQEVGYIPAENIETPYERLARLNKHRNVEIATATGDDNNALPTHAASGYLVKSRTFGDINKDSGKVSALSRRETKQAAVHDQDRSGTATTKKPGVLFGESQYLEHSELDEYDEEYMGEDDEYTDEVTEEAEEAEPAESQEDGQDDTPAPSSSPPPKQSNEPVGLYPTEAPKTQGDTEELDLPDESRRSRPGSLLGLPGSEKALNVTRVFAGENIQSESTFKTVLLSDSMTSTELVHQALQRFKLQDNVQDYAIVLHHLDGEEQILAPHEHPLRMLESLSNISSLEPTEMPSKHDSVSSLASLLDNSMVPAAPAPNRLMYDYSDDRFGKLYLVRRVPLFRVNKPPVMPSDATSQDKQLRFTIQLALFDTDLPDGTYFHPTLGGISKGVAPLDESMPTVQKRFMRLAKNATVAEVIEAGLEAFELPDAVVDGGDEVEERSRRERPRSRYTLSVKTAHGEQPLPSASKVLAAYDTLPLLRVVEADSKRKSLDFAVAPGSMDDISRTDPLFVLRLTRMEQRVELSPPPSKTAAPSWQDDSLDASSPTSPWRTSLPSSREREREREREFDMFRQDQPRLRTPRPPQQESPRVPYSLLSQAGSMREYSNARKPVLDDLPWTSETHTFGQLSRHSNINDDGNDNEEGGNLRGGIDSLHNRHAVGRDMVGSRMGSGTGNSSPSAMLDRYPSNLSPLPSSSVQNEVDSMLSRLAIDPALDPAKRAVPPPSMGVDKNLSQLPMPPPQSSLQRASSIRSVSAGDVAPDPRGMPHAHRRVGDRVLSDSTVATGTDRQGREKYNFHALYGIVDAMVLETFLSSEEAASSMLSPTGSPQNGLHRTSLVMAKLLEESPLERMWRKWNGLFSLPWPPPGSATSTATEQVRKQYAPLMGQISELENALDDTLRSVLVYRET